MTDRNMPGLEPDALSPGGAVEGDRISPGDWSRDDVMAFVEGVTAPDAAGNPAAGAESIESLQSRLTTLSSLLASQRTSTQRLIAEAGRTMDPLTHDRMMREMSEMYINHELALKLIGKLEQAVETVTKLQ